MKTMIVAFASIAMLISGSAWADHCDADAADVQAALGAATTANDDVLDAAEVLLDHGLIVCANEEDQIATAEAGSLMADPDYISSGQSMLIRALELLEGD